MRVNGALTVTNLLGNQLDAESAKMLAEVAKQKGISPCGIQRDQTTADFSNQNLKPPDAILLASDLLQADVTGALTSIDLSKNNLTNYGWDMTGIKELAAALGVNGGLTSLDLSENALCGVTPMGGTYTAEGITAIADALRMNGALTTLSLAKNKLEEAGTKAICEALEQNSTLKELDISGHWWRGSNTGGPAGARHVAKMVRVNGGLTSLDLSYNELCGLDHHGSGTYTADGIKAIADALRVNDALTRVQPLEMSDTP